jgi:hypothetical protein
VHILEDGSEIYSYYVEGARHRLDGPALEWLDEIAYYIYGKKYS